MSTPPGGTSDDKYIAGLRDAVRASREFAVSSPLADEMWQYTARSRAAREAAERHYRKTGTPWGNEPFDRLFGLSNLIMTGAADGLGSMEKVLSLPVATLGPVLAARSVIELSAVVWWFMAPEITVRQRIGRELTFSLQDARRLAAIGRKFTKVNDLHRQEPYVRSKISELGLSLSGRRVEGESKPESTELTGKLLRPHVKDGTHSEFIFQHYSAVGHGDPYGLISMVAARPSSSGTPVWHWGIDRAQLASVTEFAIIAFRDTYERVSQHMGWSNRIAYDAWMGKLRDALPD